MPSKQVPLRQIIEDIGLISWVSDVLPALVSGRLLAEADLDGERATLAPELWLCVADGFGWALQNSTVWFDRGKTGPLAPSRAEKITLDRAGVAAILAAKAANEVTAGSDRGVMTERIAGQFAKSYIAAERAAGRNPSLDGCEEAAVRQYRGGRDFLRKAYKAQIGTKVSPGRPPRSSE